MQNSDAATSPSALPGPDDMAFLEADYDHLDAALEDVNCGKQTNASVSKAVDDNLGKKQPQVSEYILGTLVVRVVAARDLEVRDNDSARFEWMHTKPSTALAVRSKGRRGTRGFWWKSFFRFQAGLGEPLRKCEVREEHTANIRSV